MNRFKLFTIYFMSLLYAGIGISHFIHEKNFEKIVPPYVPFAAVCVIVSGIFEIIFGIGLLFKKVRRIAAIGIIILLIAVFPANVYMYTSGAFPQFPQWLLLIRLPVQPLLIVWAIWILKDRKKLSVKL